MSSAGANAWNVPLELNNIQAGLSQQQAIGLTNPLNQNVQGNGKYIAGMVAPPFGTSAIICNGSDTYLIEDATNNPLLVVSNTGLVLGGANPNFVPVNAPTVSPATDSSTKIATTEFVQNAIAIGSGGLQTQTTSPVTLTASSPKSQILTGAVTYTVNLPDATTLSNGTVFYINVNTTGANTATIKNNGGVNVYVNALRGSNFKVILLNNSTANGSWDVHSYAPSVANWGTAGLTYAGDLTFTGGSNRTIAQTGGGRPEITNGVATTTPANTSNDTTLATTAFVQNKKTATTVSGTSPIDISTGVCAITGTSHSMPDGTYVGQEVTVFASENPYVYPPLTTSYNSITTSPPNDVCHYGGIIYVGMPNNCAVNGIANTNGIAQFDIATSTWSAMGTGATGGGVNKIVASPTGVIYALGSFTSMGGVANTSRIAKWSGGAWSAIGTGLNGDGWDLSFNPSDETKFMVCGAFTLAGGVANTSRVAYWDGANYNALGTGASTNIVYGSTWQTNDIVYFIGTFGAFNGVANTQSLAKWVISTATASSIATSASITNQSSIYWDSVLNCVIIGGTFTSINGNTDIIGTAKYDPATATWSNVGNAPTSSIAVKTIKRSGGILYMGGSVISAFTNKPSDGVGYSLLGTSSGVLMFNPTTQLWSPRIQTNGGTNSGFDFDSNGNIWMGFGQSNETRFYGVNLSKVNVLDFSGGLVGNVFGANTNITNLYPNQRNIFKSAIFGQQNAFAKMMWNGSQWILVSSDRVNFGYVTPTL